MGATAVLAHGGTDGLGPAGAGLVVLVVAPLLLFVAACYVRGLLRLREQRRGPASSGWRAAALVAGVVFALVVALPPVGTFAESRLSTHMAQHVAFIVVVAPLLALGAPGLPMLAGTPRSVRRRIVGLLRRAPVTVLLAPHVAWIVHIVAVWLWHLPAAYDAALESEVMHVLEHASFLGTAWLFWWHLATLSRRRIRGPAAMVYVVAAMAPGAALGAMLTFPGEVIYPAQASAAAAVGADPLLDQRIGGLIMWVPLDFLYLLVAIALFSRWFKRLEPAAEQRIAAPDRLGTARETTAVGR